MSLRKSRSFSFIASLSPLVFSKELGVGHIKAIVFTIEVRYPKYINWFLKVSFVSIQFSDGWLTKNKYHHSKIFPSK